MISVRGIRRFFLFMLFCLSGDRHIYIYIYTVIGLKTGIAWYIIRTV
jgi:hypothetical protein